MQMGSWVTENWKTRETDGGNSALSGYSQCKFQSCGNVTRHLLGIFRILINCSDIPNVHFWKIRPCHSGFFIVVVLICILCPKLCSKNSVNAVCKVICLKHIKGHSRV